MSSPVLPNARADAGRVRRALGATALLAGLALLPLASAARDALSAETIPSAQPTPQDQAVPMDAVLVSARIPKKTDTATKTATPIVELPQSVTVITAAQMNERAIHGIEEAVWYTAGAQGGFYGPDSRSGWLLVRGFAPTRYLDGLALPNGTSTGVTRIEPYGLERLEVLKGPSSVVYGAMPPGGLLNMVSKRPTGQPLHEVQAQVGSFDLRELAFDFGGPLTEDGHWLYRLTALGRNSDTATDFIRDDRYFLAPALTWKPSQSTSLTLLSRWQKGLTASGAGFLPAGGTLLPNPNGRIPRDRFTGEPGENNYDKSLASIGYEFRHDFANGVTFSQNLRYENSNADAKGPNVGAFGLLDDQRTLVRYYFPNENHTQTFDVDNNAQYNFRTGHVEHTVLAGLDYRRFNDDYASAFAFGTPPLDIFDPVYGSAVSVPDYTSHTRQIQTQLGVYLQDQIKLDRWLLTVGGRQDHVNTDTDQVIGGTHARQTDRAFSGRVGLNYLFDSGFAPYIAFSQSFQPSVGTSFDGRAFDPTKGDQVEAGVKYQPTDGRGLLTLAAYRIKQKNTLTVDPDHTLFSVQQGETRLRGLELEGRWNFSPQFSLYGDATWSDSEVTRSNDAAALGKQIAFLPRVQASLGGDYTIAAGPLAGLGFGGGVRYVGDLYGDTANQWQTPSYTLADAAVHYDSGHWRLQLNASNLFDRRYVSTCSSAGWCYYGYERRVTATARYRW